MGHIKDKIYVLKYGMTTSPHCFLPVICPEAMIAPTYPFRQVRRLLTKSAYKGII
jgi:hypothetical protein